MFGAMFPVSRVGTVSEASHSGDSRTDALILKKSTIFHPPLPPGHGRVEVIAGMYLSNTGNVFHDFYALAR